MLFLIFAVIGLKTGFASAECKTTLGETCQFPFVFDGNVYYGCTKDLDPSLSNHYCSTKTNPATREHIASNVGSCNVTCPKNDDFTKKYNEIAFEINAELTFLKEIDKKYESTCPCKPILECPTLSRLLVLLGSIPQKHIEYTNGRNYAHSKLCNARPGTVKCCYESPTNTSLLESNSVEILSTGDKLISSVEDLIFAVIGSKPKAWFVDVIAYCETTSISFGENCQFPFVYKDKVYYGCTKDLDPSSSSLQCSTRTDPSTLEHISFNVGNCDFRCPNNDEYTNEENENAFELKADLTFLKQHEYDDTSCPCKPYEQCSTFSRLFTLLASIPTKHVEYSNGLRYIRTKICDKNTRTVHCCNYDSLPTSDAQPNTHIGDYRNDTLGTWKPRSDDGECGLRLEYTNIFCVEDSKPGEFPWVVLLGYQDGDDIIYRCSGSVINRWYVLTAAYCIQPDAEPIQLLFGEQNLNTTKDCNEAGFCISEPFTRKPAKIIVHEGYDYAKKKGTNPNDIAIIRLDKPIPLYYDEKDNDVQSAVVPVCLPLEDNDVGRNLADGDRLTVTGWRRTRNSQFQTNFTLFQQNEPTGILQKRVIPILSKVECLKIGHYRENLQLNFDLQFCAGDKEGKNICEVGGPIVYRSSPDESFHQVGLVSYGSTIYCGSQTPLVYTKISGFLDWLDKNLEE